MKRLAIALAFASFAAGAYAAPVTYAIDTTHTQPRFEYNHFGYSNQVHSFDKTSGTVVYDAQARTGSVDVTIDATSVNTGYPLLDKHIQDEDFFDTAKYPTITFKSTSVKFDGDKPVSVEGNLTVKGITKPVTLTITSFQAMPHPIMKKDAIGANAVTKIKRTEFNMGKYAPYVSDDVILQIPLEAVAVNKQ
ncbi:MAG: YceI family protein [Betaproteobacteria bacterium]|nr:YceI family protein [Betaproteobacteria bacterium]